MAATLIGPIIYFLVFIAVSFFLGVFIVGAAVWAYILAFIAWIWNYKSSFDTGWLQAIVIALLADVAFVLLNVLAASVLGIIIPNGFYPRFL
jgi:hypothetical protein